jgi:hypothetical protein
MQEEGKYNMGKVLIIISIIFFILLAGAIIFYLDNVEEVKKLKKEREEELSNPNDSTILDMPDLTSYKDTLISSKEDSIRMFEVIIVISAMVGIILLISGLYLTIRWKMNRKAIMEQSYVPPPLKPKPKPQVYMTQQYLDQPNEPEYQSPQQTLPQYTPPPYPAPQFIQQPNQPYTQPIHLMPPQQRPYPIMAPMPPPRIPPVGSPQMLYNQPPQGK